MKALLILLPFTLLGACTPAVAPSKQDAQTAVVVAGKAIRQVSDLCAKHVLVTYDLPRAKQCRDRYDVARTMLADLAATVDAWGTSPPDAAHVACTVHHALDLFELPRRDLEGEGETFPTWYEARNLAFFLGHCPEITP